MISDDGFANITLVVFILIILAITLEVLTIYEIYRSVKIDIKQTSNMVLNLTINKEIREGISLIKASEALPIFNEMFDRKLNEKGFSNKVNVDFTETSFSSHPAAATCQGQVIITPSFINYLDIDSLNVKLPFNISSFIQLR